MFRFDGEIKSFTDKQKLKEFSLTRNVEGTSLREKENTTTRNVKTAKVKCSSVKANTQYKCSKSSTHKDRRKIKRKK